MIATRLELGQRLEREYGHPKPVNLAGGRFASTRSNGLGDTAPAAPSG